MTQPLSRESLATRLPAGAKDTTILVVEDNNEIRQLFRKTLLTAGFKVFQAASGEEALQLALQLSALDLLFTDLMLPRMSGRQLAHRLREWWPDLRVLYTSGYTNEQAIREGIERGVVEPDVVFLAKPFSMRELVEKACELLARVPNEEPSSAGSPETASGSSSPESSPLGAPHTRSRPTLP